jgi:hypothetical protein
VRQIVNILGYSVPSVGNVGRGYLLGGARRKTHRFDPAPIVARAFDPHDALSLQRMSCELCRRSYAVSARYRQDRGWWCPRPDCMEHAANLRGFPVRVVPL